MKHKRALKSLIIILVLLTVFVLIPFLCHIWRLSISIDKDDWYYDQKYLSLPGGKTAATFLPQQEALPAADVDFKYRSPWPWAINAWTVFDDIVNGTLTPHTYSLTLTFSDAEAYCAYKDEMFDSFQLYNEHKTEQYITADGDVYIHTVYDGKDYAGLLFDDGLNTMKYIFLYHFDSDREVIPVLIHNTDVL